MKQEKEIIKELDKETLVLLYRNLPLSLLAVLVSAIVIAVIFLNVVEQSIIEGWILTMMVIVALRYVVYLQFTSRIKNEKQTKKWEILFALGLFVNALVWVASIVLFFMDASLSDQLLLSFVVGGMVSGATYISAYRFYMFVLYSVPILMVLMIYMYIDGNYYFGGLIALYMMVTLFNAKRMTDTAAKVSVLQMNNEKLVERLVQEKNSVKAALEEATKANSMKDLFIGNISHEFRTPLNAIQGFSQVLQHKPDTPESTVTLLKKIHASGNQLLILIDVLMQYSKYKSGALVYIPTNGSILELVSTAISQERVRVLEKNLIFKVDIPENIIMNADFIMLKFIFDILIEDAVENASKESVITISIISSSENDTYEIRICNDCPMFLLGETENIFDPFAQMETTHESRNLARGLGLYVAKKMTENYYKGSLILEEGISSGYCLVMNIAKK